MVTCKCGCGIEREQFDKRGRKRFYINGHQSIGKKRKVWNDGKKNIYSKETLEKMRNKKLGKKLSKEHVRKIGVANRKNTDEENYKMKKARWKAKDNIHLKSQCEMLGCGSTKNLQRHHWNYNKPLLVNTLCKTCHTIQHVKNFDKSKYARGGI